MKREAERWRSPSRLRSLCQMWGFYSLAISHTQLFQAFRLQFLIDFCQYFSIAVCPEQESSSRSRLKQPNSALGKGGSMTGSKRKALGSWSMMLLQFEEELFTFPHASARAAVAPMLHKQRCCLYQMVLSPRSSVTKATPYTVHSCWFCYSMHDNDNAINCLKCP